MHVVLMFLQLIQCCHNCEPSCGYKDVWDALSNSRRNVCMRGYQKAFDSVSHQCLIEVLKLASTLQ